MELPGKVICRVLDGWLALLPCAHGLIRCYVQCPYFPDCYPEETESEDDEAWDEYCEQTKSKEQD